MDHADALYHTPGWLQLNAIAVHMTRLQTLRIWACRQDKLLAVLDSPLLPNLKQLWLYLHTNHAELEAEEVEALQSAIHQARPALQVAVSGYRWF